ncbi:MAG: tRNA 2-thiouridine(34) synthase MnmA [bacterium]
MKSKGVVFVGLSGGVDSGVSAALLQKAGYDVTGVFIRITVPGYPCTAGEDRLDAMRVAAHLKIPFLELDLSNEYQKTVFQTSIEEFRKGNTPNPDTLCNKEIKFGRFYEFVREHGADFVATGHYAQIKENTDSGAPALYAGNDTEKDQSYFLWMMPKGALLHTLFPVGGMQKPEVRALAEKFALPNARRKDSQGLCFLGNIPIKDMLEHELAPVPGNVLSENGDVVGEHRGAVLYTLGERHGFTLTVHSPETPAYYVIGKNIEKNTITVSCSPYPTGVTKTKISLADTNWLGAAPEGKCLARFRYRQTLLPAHISREGEEVVVTLSEPRHIPLGQSLVLYRGTKNGEVCLGGGVVVRTDFF